MNSLAKWSVFFVCKYFAIIKEFSIINILYIVESLQNKRARAAHHNNMQWISDVCRFVPERNMLPYTLISNIYYLSLSLSLSNTKQILTLPQILVCVLVQNLYYIAIICLHNSNRAYVFLTNCQ